LGLAPFINNKKPEIFFPTPTINSLPLPTI
jgi:hypothetical protein